ncbi:hypothetical protein EIK76_14460 [Rheinheimera mesophila]|uniref:DUF3806 domain-containing protein n=1 Tax=Rheinheimera mesophila TaxID=1547515 RepID=A0A3P3QEL4_9GAMM|nr:hypothetical protein [Rheinheimera mesophila]KKL00594.1 hypothetical protein SD53_13000 [Rheinheimera mesophila]RRJ19647.1 hypothetical protein EIK76_14460 [Rheinheimera mesophila]
MNKQELTELMQATAQDAVVYAAEEHQVLLDFSLDSLVKVDEILSELYLRQQEQRHADDLLFTLCNVFGAYTGEVFIHHVGGEWYHDESTPDAPYICVRYNGKEFPFASLVYHQIAKTPNASLRNYVEQAMTNAMQ